MANMMAIISKAQFEDEFPNAKVGDVLPITEYRSVHKALDRLSDGGSLFLMTVRPPNEELWLVGVLEKAKKGKTAWKASANRQAVRVVARDQLKFENGKGLSAKKGALGMSLQTPRALADEDVAMLVGVDAPKSAARAKEGAFSRELLQLETWRILPRKKRDEVVAAIAAAKGLDVVGHEDGEGQARVRFRHPSGIELALIPGGRFAMGLNDDEQARLLAFLREEEDTTGAIEMLENPDPLRPVHDVDVAPFLLAVTTSDDDFDADELASVTKRLGKAGLRLPSEAEWEYACRGGFDGAFAHGDEIPSSTSPEPNGFGLYAMGSQMEVCADGYHANYKGAPTTSEPWKGKGRVTRGGAEPLCWDGDRVWMLTLAAARAPFDPDDVCVSARPALSLFSDYARETPVKMLPAKRAYRAKVKPAAKAAPVAAVSAPPTGETLAQKIEAIAAPIRKVADGKIRSATYRNGGIEEIDINKLDAKAIDAIAKLTKLRAIEVTGDQVKLSDLAPILARHQIESLSLSEAKPDDLIAMLSSPDLTLRSLSLGSLSAADVVRVLKTRGAAKLQTLSLGSVVGLDAAATEAIAALPLVDLSLTLAETDASAFAALAKMTSLRSFMLSANEAFPEGCRALSKLASKLTRLWINDAVPADVIAALVAAQPALEDVTLPALEKKQLAPIVSTLKAPRKLAFDLGNNYEHLGSDGAKLLVKAAWPSVESLDVSSCGLGDDGAKAIAEWPESLTTLDLANNRISAKGAESIAKARGLRGLRSLRIVMNPIGSGGATALAAAKFSAELRELNLFSNRIGAPGLRSLIGAMPKLEKLTLGSENSYGDEGMKLAAAGMLPNIRNLSVSAVSSKAIETWLASGHAEQIEWLFIGNTTLSRQAAEGIARLPRLVDVNLNFVSPDKPGALDPINKRWWSSLSISR